MNTVQNLLSPKASVLSQIRLIAFFVALAMAVPAAAFPKFALLFVAAGVVLGSGIAMYLEFRSEEAEEREELLATLPAEFEGLGCFTDTVFLELKQPAQPGQLEMSSIVGMQKERGQRKTATVVRLAGKNHFLVDSDRFIALLLDKMTEDADKAAEHALLMGLKRYGSVQMIEKELERFLSDKSVTEVIKSDFRGNMLMVINRSGEKIIRELIKKSLNELKQSPPPTVSEPTSGPLPKKS